MNTPFYMIENVLCYLRAVKRLNEIQHMDTNREEYAIEAVEALIDECRDLRQLLKEWLVAYQELPRTRPYPVEDTKKMVGTPAPAG